MNGAIRVAWFPISLDAIHTEEGKILIRNDACAYLDIGFSAAITIPFFAPHLIKLIATPAYFQGHMVVGILCLFFVLDGYLGISQLGLF
jgi:hypothetical protein